MYFVCILIRESGTVFTVTKKKLNTPMKVGIAILVFFIFVAVFAKQLMPYTLDTLFKPYEKPSALHILGTNDIGQDILSELILGTRTTLLTGILSAAFIVIIGTGTGIAGGYRVLNS